MRKVLSKLLYMAVATMATITFSACKETPDTPDTPNTPDTPKEAVITLDNTAIKSSSDGGEYVVTYSIENPVEGATIELKCSADWVHFTQPAANEIGVVIDANTSPEPRTTTVSVDYATNTNVAEFSIEQEGYVAPAPFTIEIEELLATSCITNIKASDQNMWYVMYMVDDVQYFYDYAISTAEELFEDDKATFMKNAEFDGMNLGDYMETYQSIFKGDKRVQWSNMRPGLKSVLYVYGIEFNEDRTDYTMLTDVYYEIIEPKTADIVDGSFNVDISVEGPDARFDVSPEGWDGYYCVEVYNNGEELYLEMGATPDEGYTSKLGKNWMDLCGMYQMYYGYTIQDILDEFCHIGNKSVEMELMSEVQYCVVVYGVKEVDGLLQLVTQPVVKHFATERVTTVDMSIDIAVDNIGSRVADISVNPSLDDEQYLFLLVPSDNIMSTENIDIINEILVNFYNYAYRFTGSINSHVSTLNPDTLYSVYCFGFHGGVITTDLYHYSFTTEKAAPGEINLLDVEIKGPYAADELGKAMPEKYGNYTSYTSTYVVSIAPKTDIPTNDVFYLAWDYDTFSYYNRYYPDIVIGDTLTYYCDIVGISRPCAYEIDNVVTALAMDSKGNLCDLWVSDIFNYTVDDVRPIEELVTLLSSVDTATRVLSADAPAELTSLVYGK